MIEEMKNQINHLIETFDYSNVEDYRDLLYVIYLNWIENNGENEEINTIINNFIKIIITDHTEKSNNNDNNNNEDNNNCYCNNVIDSYELYRYFLGDQLKGIPDKRNGY
jgi:hypothetical protein